MASPFIIPNRNAGYSAPKSPYENQWVASARDYKLKQQGVATPALPKGKPPVQKPAPITHDGAESQSSQREELKALAKKSTKQVREWLREQVEALDDSSSD